MSCTAAYAALALFLTLSAGSVVAQGLDAPDAPDNKPALKHDSSGLSSMVIWGIVNYTRWPQEDGPLKVCLLESSAQTEVIRRSAEAFHFRRVIVLREPPATLADIKGCDVAYFGSLPAQQTTLLLRTLVNLPVLTIGEGTDFCSAGGMFCLASDRETAAENGEGMFATNLDVIARSGLRVNPRVLRLSQQMRGQGN
jgi:hypothetical protein